MRGLIQMRYLFVYPIHRERVLNEIVCADAEEIDFARQHIGRNGCAWNFDHRAHLSVLTILNAVATELFFALLQDFNRSAQLQ